MFVILRGKLMNCEHCLYYCATKVETIGLCSRLLDYSKQASIVDTDSPACEEFTSALAAIELLKAQNTNSSQT